MAVGSLDPDAEPRPDRPDPPDRPRRARRRLALAAVIVVLLAVMAGLLAGGRYYSDQLLTWPDGSVPSLASQLRDVRSAGVNAEPVTATGPLGTYHGVLVPGTADTWVLVVHGRGGSPVIAPALAPAMAADGRPVLFTSFRNDGFAPDDPDGYTTFGDREWRDLQAWVDVATAAGARSIVLHGFSMGGSIVASFLQSSPDADLVRAVVLDSPVLSLQATLEVQADAVGVPEPLVPALLVATKAVSSVRAGMDFAALEHVARWDADLPVLLVHGTADTTVPDDPTVELAADLGRRATLVRPAGVDHVAYVEADDAGYRARIRRFLDRVTPEPL